MAARGDSGPLRAEIEALQARLAAEGKPHLESLAREYVTTLDAARRLRAEAQAEPTSELKSGRLLLHPGFAAADSAIRHAVSIAKVLGLKSGADSPADDPFAELDAHPLARLYEYRNA